MPTYGGDVDYVEGCIATLLEGGRSLDDMLVMGSASGGASQSAQCRRGDVADTVCPSAQGDRPTAREITRGDRHVQSRGVLASFVVPGRGGGEVFPQPVCALACG